jgi:hypothetical protein
MAAKRMGTKKTLCCAAFSKKQQQHSEALKAQIGAILACSEKI